VRGVGELVLLERGERSGGEEDVAIVYKWSFVRILNTVERRIQGSEMRISHRRMLAGENIMENACLLQTSD